ncbi:MAG: hypothetical protein K2M79_03010 [Muribaculaceae bacterium]|nr:hypothetical protein [Muribaculaceae bacterium]
MITDNKYILSAAIFSAAAFATPAAVAQSATSVINIDRTIVPEQRAATRMGSFNPTIFVPETEKRTLSVTEYTGTAPLTPMLTRLSPARYDDTVALYKYRGYALAGYFPLAETAVAAGYRFLDNSTSTVGAWLNYDGSAYKTHDFKFNDQNVALDLYGTHSFKWGTFSAALNYTYRHAGVKSDEFTAGKLADPAGLNTFDVTLGFTSERGRKIIWDAAVKYDMNRYSSAVYGRGLNYEVVDWMNQGKGALSDLFNFSGSVAFGAQNNRPRGGIDAEISYFRSRGLNIPDIPHLTLPGGWNIYPVVDHHLTEYALTPFVNFSSGSFTAHVGIRFMLHEGWDESFHVAPDINLAWKPSGTFAIFADFDGGTVMNTLASATDYTPYIPSSMAYTPSDLDITGRVGFRVGPFKGAALEAYGAYAHVSQWLMPSVYEHFQSHGTAYLSELPQGVLCNRDLHGFMFGARLTYSYRHNQRAYLSYEHAPVSVDKGWYQWRDHASTVLHAGVEYSPLKPLMLSLDYEMRRGRRAYLIGGTSFEELGHVDNLNLRGTYAVNSQLSVFVNAENLLCKRYLYLPGIYSRGLHGLLGVTYKF